MDLTNIVDSIGLSSSFPIVPDGHTVLTTPYGETKFQFGSYRGLYRANWVEITHPNGEKERVEYSEIAGNGIPNSEPLAIVPKGVPVRNYILFGRNTYFWDRKAYAEGYSKGDYSGARVYHWAHGLDYTTASPILESFKPPLEHRIWFNYDGQVNASFAGTSDRPTKIARTIEDGTTQLYQFEYNSVGNATKAIDPLGREISIRYGPNDVDLVEVRQTRAGQNELLARATYNAQHLPLTLTDAAGQTTRLGYNARGQILAATNALGHVTTFAYDPGGYLLAVDGPLPGTNDTSRFTYDSVGHLRTATDVDGYTLTFDYDGLERLTRVTYPDTTYESITYNRLDPELFRDRAGRETRLSYDSLRQLAAVQDPLGRVTRYNWCGCGGLDSVIDPLGRMTSWVRDLQGRVKAKVYPDGSQTRYTYDTSTGWLRSVRDARNQVTMFDYNLDGTMRQKSYLNALVATPSVKFTYDSNYGRVTTMEDGTELTTYAYNPIPGVPAPGAGRLASIDGPFANDTITFSYDELGREARRSVNGLGVKRTWDAAGRLTQVTNGLGTFVYTWDGDTARPSTVSYPNGQRTDYAFFGGTQDRLLESITHRLPNNSVLSEFTYGYNGVPQINTWNQLQGGVLKTWAPAYDDADRLLGVTESLSVGVPHSYTYDYDASDNRTTDQTDLNRAEFSYNVLNQLITASNSPAATVAFTWDAANRLVVITNGTHRTEFTYDGIGRRVRIVETENGSITSDRRYLWCGADLCEERDSSGATVLKRYFHRGLRAENGADLPVGNYFFTRDHVRSIREMTDSAGTLRAQYAYSPFGIRQSLGGDLNADFGFTGHYQHPASGLSLAFYRAYSSDLGRWLSRDPLGEKGGLNLYHYARNDPLNVIDLYGLDGVGWGVGLSGELSFVQPLTSGGGGAVGVNLQYLSEGPDEGPGLFTYTPGKDGTVGVNIGVSLQFNVTWGNGGWTGLFENLALGVNKFGAGYFQSPCADKTGEGWQGVSVGVGVGPSPVTAAEYTTDYSRVPILQSVANLFGGPLWY